MKKNNVKLAVILAAGMGQRLRKIESEMPKGFIHLGGITLIERVIRQLKHNNIEKIIIVTGYKAEYYNELKKKYHFVETVHNGDYQRSGSMYSLYCAKQLIGKNSFLLLESDLLFESRAIESLLLFPESNAILISSETKAGDEVFVSTKGNLFHCMSKEKDSLPNITGELVGISLISSQLFEIMKIYAISFFEKDLMLDYEYCLNAISDQTDIFFHKIDNLIWTEIDDPEQFNRAQKIIYPNILDKECKED